MKQIKKGNLIPEVFVGTCRRCGAEYEANRSELKIDRCPKEGYEFASKECPDCKGNIFFYAKKS